MVKRYLTDVNLESIWQIQENEQGLHIDKRGEEGFCLSADYCQLGASVLWKDDRASSFTLKTKY